MNETPFFPEAEYHAIRRAIEILAGLFWGPSIAASEELLGGDFFQPFEILSSDPAFESPETLDAIRTEIEQFSNPDELFQSLEEEYVRLFITDKDGAPAPLYASCYEGKHPLLMGESAIRMKERFAAEGLELANGMGEPPDHLSIELEYLYYLLSRANDESPREGVIKAAKFVSTALLPWTSSFNKRLGDHPEHRFYPLAASLLQSVLRYISTRVPCD